MFFRILKGLKAYLTDWRNLLSHALMGIVLLVIALWAPVPGWVRILLLVCIVCFNTWRMNRGKKKAGDKAPESTE